MKDTEFDAPMAMRSPVRGLRGISCHLPLAGNAIHHLRFVHSITPRSCGPWQRRPGTAPSLRLAYASHALALGESLTMIGRLLGHSKIATTARYAHLAAEPVKYAANDIAKVIAKSMG